MKVEENIFVYFSLFVGADIYVTVNLRRMDNIRKEELSNEIEIARWINRELFISSKFSVMPKLK